MNTLNETLIRLTIDQLKALMAWLPDTPRVGRKDELIASILRGLSAEGLRGLWDRLDAMQRFAVAEALYAPGGIFQRNQFRAKYGQFPEFAIQQKGSSHYSSSKSPTRLGLFLYWQDGQYSLPEDLHECLLAFVPKPDPVNLKTLAVLDDTELTVRQGEREALLDLPILLRLVDQGGKLQVSDKTALPGATTLRLLTEQLNNGDYYAEKPKQNRWEQEIGPIKAFAWPLLLQAGGLAQRHGSKLALSPAGLKALRSPAADVVRSVWNKWLKTTLLDEFSRIDAIKGQKAKGRGMTAAAPRRMAIADALSHCPVGAWVDVNEFSRFMVATDRVFEVSHDPWKLYISDTQYGSLGHSGFHDWNILQFRYLLCFLFEYAAPLGIVDIAYRDPDNARKDFRDLWGTDDLRFLSRYDGLICFRLTALGAYCLDLSTDYTPAPLQSTVRFSILPSLKIHVIGGMLATEESLVLDVWAEQATDSSWQLDRQKALRAIEKGHDAAELIAFLQARDDQALPETLESFIKNCQSNGNALKVVGSSLLITCRDANIAALISAHKETAGLCLRAGEKQLVVRIEHEDKFRTLVRVLGFGITA